MFADDAKILRNIITGHSCLEFQSDLAKLYEWSDKWHKMFNAEKGHVIKFFKSEMKPD